MKGLIKKEVKSSMKIDLSKKEIEVIQKVLFAEMSEPREVVKELDLIQTYKWIEKLYQKYVE